MSTYQITDEDHRTLGLLFQADPLDGWLTYEKAQVVYGLVREHQPIVCVELGTFAGMSEFAAAFALKANGSGLIFGIDPWSIPPCLEGTNSQENAAWWSQVRWDRIIAGYFLKVHEFELLEWSCHLRKHDAECLQFFQDDSIQYIHFDSNHSEEVAVATVNRWWPKLAQGCAIVMDDIDWSGQRQAVDALLKLGAVQLNDYQKYATFIK